MTEHKKLQWIADKIGYDIDLNLYKIGRTYIRDKSKKQCTQCLTTTSTDRILDVREIIFRPKFFNKFRIYYSLGDFYTSAFFNGTKEDWDKLSASDRYDIKENQLHNILWSNLDDPVDYLYNLIKD